MISEAIDTFTRKISGGAEWENEYKPAVGVNDADRVRHFTNVDESLLKRIREVKNDVKQLNIYNGTRLDKNT